MENYEYEVYFVKEVDGNYYEFGYQVGTEEDGRPIITSTASGYRTGDILNGEKIIGIFEEPAEGRNYACFEDSSKDMPSDEIEKIYGFKKNVKKVFFDSYDDLNERLREK